MLIKFLKNPGVVLILCLFACCSAYAVKPISTHKTVLITNGTTGVGKEIAITFQKANWNVWVTCSNAKSCIQIHGVNVEKVDGTNLNSVKQLVTKIKSKSKSLDVLVNIPVYNIIGPQEAISITQAAEIFNNNIIGPLTVTQEILPLMRASHSGKIINVINTPGTRAIPGLGLYTASHMAIEGLSEALATELAPWQIKVSIVESSAVDGSWAKDTPSAANIDSHPGYKNFTHKLRADLTKKSNERGIHNQHIANLVLQIANTDKPNMRYQADKMAVSLLGEMSNDPTGNVNRDKMISLSKELFDLPATF